MRQEVLELELDSENKEFEFLDVCRMVDLQAEAFGDIIDDDFDIQIDDGFEDVFFFTKNPLDLIFI